jgi:hypothetical protein
MQHDLCMVYLDLGERSGPHLPKGELAIHVELRYSLATLLAEKSQPFSILIYTDKPHLYAGYPAEVVDVASITPPELRDWSYIYRAKPCVLLHALQQRAEAYCFLDSDTFILPGFVVALREAIDRGAVMCGIGCPHTVDGRRLDGGIPFSGNSGVIGLHSRWGDTVLSDALSIIDTKLKAGGAPFTLEQDAISEAIWRNGIPVAFADPWITHYCSASRKRYMHMQIGQLLKTHGSRLPPMRPQIKINLARVKLYQWYWDVKRTVQGKPGR